jgi:uncharacterized membrane protein (Fun14 family)
MSRDNDKPLAVGVVAGAAGGLAGLLTSPLRSKLFLVALLATLAGGGYVLYGQIQSDTPVPAWAPNAMRIGASFVAAFAFTFLVRKAVMTALLVGGTLVAGAILLNKLGVGITQSQLDALKHQIEEGAQAIQQAGDSTWNQLKHYLPSGGAAGFGAYKGARFSHKSAPDKD